jgi:hypothetical protein
VKERQSESCYADEKGRKTKSLMLNMKAVLLSDRDGLKARYQNNRTGVKTPYQNYRKGVKGQKDG